jgi:hypothetical protein
MTHRKLLLTDAPRQQLGRILTADPAREWRLP